MHKQEDLTHFVPSADSAIISNSYNIAIATCTHTLDSFWAYVKAGHRNGTGNLKLKMIKFDGVYINSQVVNLVIYLLAACITTGIKFRGWKVL